MASALACNIGIQQLKQKNDQRDSILDSDDETIDSCYVTGNRSEDETSLLESDGNDVTDNDVNSSDVRNNVDEVTDFSQPCDVNNEEADDFPLDVMTLCSDYAKQLKEFYPRVLSQFEGSKKSLPLIIQSAAFCNALMVDNDKTKARLKELEEKTAKLEKENAQLKSAARRSPVQAVDSPQSAGESSYEMDRNLKAKLQARILKLEAQRTEILRVNKQWDSQYRRLKQEHDKSISDVSNDVTRTQQKETKRRKDMELLLSAAKREIQNATQEKSVLTRRCATTHAQSVALKLEVTKLKENNRKLETDNSCLEAENARLGQALEAAYSIRQRMSESIPPDALPPSSGMINNNNNFALPTSDPTSPGFNNNEHPPINSNNSEGREDITLEELKTRVEVLQQQVKIYREDFETERRDREKSQGEKQSLDELLTQARHQLHALTQQVRTNEQDFKQERREKERLQRQLQWTVSRDQNRYLGEPIATTTRGANDPPAYFHRDNDYVANNTRASRRRQRGTPPQYPGPSDITGENLLSYPPSDPHY